MAAKARDRKVRRQQQLDGSNSLTAAQVPSDRSILSAFPPLFNLSAFAQKNGARLTVTAANPIPSDRRSSKPAAV